jgi:integrase/recombinase XerD
MDMAALVGAAEGWPDQRGLVVRVALEILYATGLLMSELLALRRTALAGDLEMLAVAGKCGAERLVPLSDAARRAAAALVSTQTKDSPWLFPGPDPRRPMSRVGLSMLIKIVASKAGIDPARVSPRAMRHCFTSHRLVHGADLRTVQVPLSHSDMATTHMYTHV